MSADKHDEAAAAIAAEWFDASHPIAADIAKALRKAAEEAAQAEREAVATDIESLPAMQHPRAVAERIRARGKGGAT